MNKKNFLKTTAQVILAFLIVNSMFQGIVKAQNQESTCTQVSGNYYITTELVRACGYLNLSCTSLSSIQAYPSETACTRGAVERYGCIPATHDKVFFGTQSGNAYQVNFTENEVSYAEAFACLKEKTDSLVDRRTPNYSQYGAFCSETTKFFQCKCSKTLVGSGGIIGEIINWSTGNSNYSCFMTAISTPQLVELKKIKSLSPFALIKTVTDVLFAVAVFIFIINLLRIGMVYVRSGGIPDNLKNARTLLNNTIAGMIFLLLVSGLIAYTNNAFGL